MLIALVSTLMSRWVSDSFELVYLYIRSRFCCCHCHHHHYLKISLIGALLAALPNLQDSLFHSSITTSCINIIVSITINIVKPIDKAFIERGDDGDAWDSFNFLGKDWKTWNWVSVKVDMSSHINGNPAMQSSKSIFLSWQIQPKRLFWGRITLPTYHSCSTVFVRSHSLSDFNHGDDDHDNQYDDDDDYGFHMNVASHI